VAEQAPARITGIRIRRPFVPVASNSPETLLPAPAVLIFPKPREPLLASPYGSFRGHKEAAWLDC